MEVRFDVVQMFLIESIDGVKTELDYLIMEEASQCSTGIEDVVGIIHINNDMEFLVPANRRIRSYRTVSTIRMSKRVFLRREDFEFVPKRVFATVDRIVYLIRQDVA